jgi:hypothetical protein
MSSDEGAAEGGQAATTAPTQASLAGDLAVALVVDDAVAQPQPQQLPTAPPGASAGRPTGGKKGSMAENDRVWASASALTQAGANLVGSLLRWMARIVSPGLGCPFGGFVAVLPVHQGLDIKGGSLTLSV